MAPMRLGLFGGRFDPPHLGHLRLAEEALEQLELEVLFFIPALAPPHKPTVAPAGARCDMLTLATTDHPRFALSRLELERGGPSYTFDTVRAIKGEHPEAELFFLTGADAYGEIASWHRARELVSEVHMVAASRRGYTLETLEPFFKRRVRHLDTPLLEVSSSDIRKRIKGGRSVRYLVPELVESYLVKHHLYR